MKYIRIRGIGLFSTIIGVKFGFKTMQGEPDDMNRFRRFNIM